MSLLAAAALPSAVSSLDAAAGWVFGAQVVQLGFTLAVGYLAPFALGLVGWGAALFALAG